MITRLPAIIETITAGSQVVIDYTPSIGATGIATLVIKNNSEFGCTYTIYIRKDGADVELQKKKIPPYQIWRVYSLADITLSNGMEVVIDASILSYNYFFSVNESNS